MKLQSGTAPARILVFGDPLKLLVSVIGSKMSADSLQVHELEHEESISNVGVDAVTVNIV